MSESTPSDNVARSSSRALAALRKRCRGMRGHAIEWGPPMPGGSERLLQLGQCELCGLEVGLDTRPPPNGIDVGGEACAVGCSPVERKLVVFRRLLKSQGGDVIALFPLEAGIGPGTCCSYQHVGQHGSASFDVVGLTSPARLSDPDVVALRCELQVLGYRLDVRARMPSAREIATSRRRRGPT